MKETVGNFPSENLESVNRTKAEALLSEINEFLRQVQEDKTTMIQELQILDNAFPLDRMVMDEILENKLRLSRNDLLGRLNEIDELEKELRSQKLHMVKMTAGLN